MGKKICVLSLSLPIEADARLNQLLESLAQCYELTVIGYGDSQGSRSFPYLWKPVDWRDGRIQRVIEQFMLLLGKFHPAFYRLWYSMRPCYKQALSYARESSADAFLARGWAALPIAVCADRRKPILFDLGEYQSSEAEHNTLRSTLFSPLVVHMLHQYVKFVGCQVVTSEVLAEKYKVEFGIAPIVIRDTTLSNLNADDEGRKIVAIYKNLFIAEEWYWHYEGPSVQDYIYYMFR